MARDARIYITLAIVDASKNNELRTIVRERIDPCRTVFNARMLSSRYLRFWIKISPFRTHARSHTRSRLATVLISRINSYLQ
ncbi:hypothetical protein PUN28_015524 [Cardiocondyla obscurior]|uniref:Uncharacterized protein n=1 Tax=Cardiocondyla obscurior TaxID=286306 RepID=A0AAW2ETE3_9HYME